MTSVRLNLGTAGRAFHEGRIREIMPIEERALHAAAGPFDDDGEIRDVPVKAREAREGAIVRARCWRPEGSAGDVVLVGLKPHG